MTSNHLVLRGLTYYWRTHVAVVAGVATAVAVLAGALLVGDSIRGSLRDFVLQRLGRTDYVVASTGFFRERLANDLAGAPTFNTTFRDVAPLIVVPGFVTEQGSGRRVGSVRVYGVDERFWRFHGMTPQGPIEREALVSPALAGELRAQPDSTILVRVQRPSDIPLESVQGRKDDLGRTLRLTVRTIIPASSMGEFSLEPQQGDVRAVFVPLAQLQKELEVGSRVNTILVLGRGADRRAVAAMEDLVRRGATLEDLGLTLQVLDGRGALRLGSQAGFLDDVHAAAAVEAGQRAGIARVPVLTYLANTLRHGDREIPYSLVAAIDVGTLAPNIAIPPGDVPLGSAPPIVLNDWAASELQAQVGDILTMEYYLWEEPGQLVTRASEFRVAGVTPVNTADRDLVPDYPGISDSPTIGDWDPPFPVDLRRIRPADESYWEQYRTTPKAYISLDAGQRIWRSRYGALTSLRLVPPPGESLETAAGRYADELREGINPLAMGLAVRDVRGEGLAASRGATDFGAYFIYFSFFIVASALLLAALFFKLGVEHRVREVGLLRAVGFGQAEVRRLFMAEGILLAIAGAAIGVIGAVGYAALLMKGLGSWWIDAVGTSALTLHVSVLSLLAGAFGGIVAAVVCIWWTLRGLTRISERSLLAGEVDDAKADLTSLRQGRVALRPDKPVLAGRSVPDRPGGPPKQTRRRKVRLYDRGLRRAAAGLAVTGVALLVASAAGAVESTGAFFGAGTAFLVSMLCLFGVLFRRPLRYALGGHGWFAVSRLGARYTTYRPGRSVLSIAVIASATFILVSVDAFRKDTRATPEDVRSGLGGYTLLVETLLPIVHDPNTQEGRAALSLFDLEATTIEPFRLLPGDDTSCLNLYEPRNPRILAPRDSFLASGRFAFQSSLASSDAERANPWLLLLRDEPDGAVPVIADANSMTYVLHRRLGDDIVITRGDRQIRLRLVAALSDSIFQGELLMSQARFLDLFPDEQGYRFLLMETAPAQVAAVARELEDALVDVGADATATSDRLAEFHRVENTYLSTFQTLGGLGLLLGTLGLGAVLLRNALERRRELALLEAVGYRRQHFLVMAAAETTLLLSGGLGAGAVCAGLAIAPAVAERGGQFPITSGGALLLFAVLTAGLLSSLVAARAASRAPLLESLRSE